MYYSYSKNYSTSRTRISSLSQLYPASYLDFVKIRELYGAMRVCTPSPWWLCDGEWCLLGLKKTTKEKRRRSDVGSNLNKQRMVKARSTCTDWSRHMWKVLYRISGSEPWKSAVQEQGVQRIRIVPQIPYREHPTMRRPSMIFYYGVPVRYLVAGLLLVEVGPQGFRLFGVVRYQSQSRTRRDCINPPETCVSTLLPAAKS